jgi:hypothetical protein
MVSCAFTPVPAAVRNGLTTVSSTGGSAGGTYTRMSAIIRDP